MRTPTSLNLSANYGLVRYKKNMYMNEELLFLTWKTYTASTRHFATEICIFALVSSGDLPTLEEGDSDHQWGTDLLGPSRASPRTRRGKAYSRHRNSSIDYDLEYK